jgi:hypothetical protein
VPSFGIGKRETFAWRVEGQDHAGTNLGYNDDLGLDTKRELFCESSGEVVARWTENAGSSMTRTSFFKFIDAGAADHYGPQWEIIAVISCLQILHEEYHATKPAPGGRV